MDANKEKVSKTLKHVKHGVMKHLKNEVMLVAIDYSATLSRFDPPVNEFWLPITPDEESYLDETFSIKSFSHDKFVVLAPSKNKKEEKLDPIYVVVEVTFEKGLRINNVFTSRGNALCYLKDVAHGHDDLAIIKLDQYSVCGLEKIFYSLCVTNEEPNWDIVFNRLSTLSKKLKKSSQTRTIGLN